MFVPGRYFRINKFSWLLNRPLVRTWKSVPTHFVQNGEISGLSDPGIHESSLYVGEDGVVQILKGDTHHLQTGHNLTARGRCVSLPLFPLQSDRRTVLQFKAVDGCYKTNNIVNVEIFAWG